MATLHDGKLDDAQRARRKVKNQRNASRSGQATRPSCRELGCNHPKHGGKNFGRKK